MTICVAGKQQIAVDVLELCVARYGVEDVVAIGNATDDFSDGWQPSYKRRARSLGVKLVRLNEVYEVDDLTFMSVEFDQIIRPKRFRSNKLYNIHFSLLPRYRGMYTAVWPLLNGDAESGVTLHVVDPGIDTGDIIAQTAFPLPPEMDARQLYLACMEHGRDLIVRNLDALVAGAVVTTPQTSIGATYHPRGSLDFKSVQIPVGTTAWQMQNYVRAFAFREYQLPVFRGSEIARAIITTQRSSLKPGEVVEHDPTRFVVATHDFDVILEIDPKTQV